METFEMQLDSLAAAHDVWIDKLAGIREKHPKAFLGDTFIMDEVARLTSIHRIRTIIETGTWDGDTTEYLAAISPFVMTIDIDGERQVIAARRIWGLGIENIWFIPGNSAHVMRCLMSIKLDHDWDKNSSSLFYLDAHGKETCPLLGELKAIADAKIKPVIVIHDFFNPIHPNYHFDTYPDTGPFNWKLIEQSIHAIYGDKFTVHYNDETVGDGIGVIYIEPTK